MNRTFFYLIFLFYSTTTQSQSGPIKWHQGSFDEVQKEAERTGKFIFVDVYADWCKPCKVMDEKVFSNPDVQAILNTFFINYKANAEKNGRSTASTYGVRGYPTFLFLTPTGEFFDQHMGMLPLNDFIYKSNQVLKQIPYAEIFRSYDQLWQNNELDIKGIREFLAVRKALEIPSDNLVEGFLERLPKDSIHTERTQRIVVLLTQSAKSEGVEYLLQHKHEKRCADKLNLLLSESSKSAVKEQSKKELKRSLDLLKKIEEIDWREKLRSLEIKSDFYLASSDKNDFWEFAKVAIEEDLMPEITTQNMSSDSIRFHAFAGLLSNLIYPIIQNTDQPDAFKTCFDWLEKMNAVSPSIQSLLNQATIATKLSQQEVHCQKLNQALLLAQQQNSSLTEITHLLQNCH